MNDTRFIELVNLYIDRQATPAEAAEFEQEIQTNIQRRQLYRHYCRMHHGTKLVYESFRAHAGQGRPTASQPGNIAHLRNRQRRNRWTYAAAGLAAAASIALILGRVVLPANPDAAPVIAAVESAPAATTAPVAVSLPDSAYALAEMRESLRTDIDYASLVAVLREEEQRLMSLPRAGAPAQVVTLFEDSVFTPRTPGSANRDPVNSRGRNPRAQVEFTAFQFQR